MTNRLCCMILIVLKKKISFRVLMYYTEYWNNVIIFNFELELKTWILYFYQIIIVIILKSYNVDYVVKTTKFLLNLYVWCILYCYGVNNTMYMCVRERLSLVFTLNHSMTGVDNDPLYRNHLWTVIISRRPLKNKLFCYSSHFFGFWIGIRIVIL